MEFRSRLLRDAQRLLNTFPVLRHVVNAHSAKMATNLGTLIGAAGAAQVITVLAAPVSARIYSPEIFGVWGRFMATASLVMSISTLRFEMAIPTSATLSEALSAVRVSMAVLTGFFGFTLLLAAGIRGCASLAWLRVMLPCSWFLPLLVAGNGFCMIMTYLAVREHWYGAIGNCRVRQSLATAAFQLGGGLIGLGPSGLISGSAVGSSVGAAAIARKAGLTSIASFWPRAGDGQTARKNLRMALLASGSALLTVIGSQLPILLVAARFSDRDTGLFVMAMRLVSYAENLITNACAQVFYGEACTLARDAPHGLRGLLTSWTVLLSLLAATAALGMYGFADVFTRTLFGPKWYGAGAQFRVLAPLLATLILINPLSMIVYVIGRPQFGALWDGFRITLVLVCFHFSTSTPHSLSSSVLLWTTSLACASLLWIALLFWLVGSYCANQAKGGASWSSLISQSRSRERMEQGD
jgi:O-antigen/teichoic acid export membrane protein